MPALESIEVEGYKSIRSATIELGAINVLIGANGSGKSNLVSLFGLLADLADRRLQLHVARAGGANAVLHFGSKTTRMLQVELRFGQLTYSAALLPSAGDTLVFGVEVSLSSGQRHADVTRDLRDLLRGGESIGSAGHKETGLAEAERAPELNAVIADPVVTTMKGWRRFHFHDTGRSAPAKQKHKIDDNQSLRAEGDNIASYLFALRTTATGSYRRIVEQVRAIAPFFDDFVLEPDAINPAVIQLAWRHTSDDALFLPDALSDGTLRFICLATLLLQPTLPELVVIDEPELGLHPFAITQLAALVRAAATKTQVLLATQSVTLLDQFDASEVIVAERSGGESIFRRLDEAALAEWREEYSLGDLWLKNVLGGRPGT